jgi:hypothetical protein
MRKEEKFVSIQQLENGIDGLNSSDLAIFRVENINKMRDHIMDLKEFLHILLKEMNIKINSDGSCVLWADGCFCEIPKRIFDFLKDNILPNENEIFEIFKEKLYLR